MVTITTYPLETLRNKINEYSQEKATGNLTIRNHEILLGKVFLLHGRLLYIKDELRPVRRFSRVCRQLDINWPAEELNCSPDQPWEYQLLYQGISKKRLNVGQAKTAITNVAEEFLFDLVSQEEIITEWETRGEGESGLSLGLALSGLEIEGLIETVSEKQQSWVDNNLAEFNGSLVPTLAPNAQLKNNSGLGKYLNGKFTLWDLSIALNKSLLDVTKALIKFKEKQLIEFREVADLAVPSFISIAQDPNQANDSSKQKKGLIACIDDSPIVAHSMKKLLAPLGYDIITITEPMHGFSDLVDQQPDLIFLDLMMPNVNGYSVCKFLRETESFQETPIIILTAQSGAIDRARAKMAGATDFLGKPPKPGRVIEVVQQYTNHS
ncbi:response regulator receiver protein [Halothece sp. PCC 7418]|uniref:response regulator n=1 Tax=Halothece sp. (strain PCC 7418) TaxID=65093 RepID=UPI0002A0853E|nr:response regulator [Halothece sp. PCC 7418]AFZ43214.1 response regulator receiver protein [Halothece sp. PCC 7418]